MLTRFSERFPKDKGVGDLSIDISMGITTHTLSLVMPYHLQKVLLKRANRNVGKRLGTLCRFLEA